MKLFKVNYMEDNDYDSYLTVGNSIEEVQKREENKLMSERSCIMFCNVYEVNEVDGCQIIVKPYNVE